MKELKAIYQSEHRKQGRIHAELLHDNLYEWNVRLYDKLFDRDSQLFKDLQELLVRRAPTFRANILFDFVCVFFRLTLCVCIPLQLFLRERIFFIFHRMADFPMVLPARVLPMAVCHCIFVEDNVY